MKQADSDENDDKLPELPELETPALELAPGATASAEDVLKNKLKAYENSILALQIKRNQINAAIKHRRAQAQAMHEAIKALQRHTK